MYLIKRSKAEQSVFAPHLKSFHPKLALAKSNFVTLPLHVNKNRCEPDLTRRGALQ